MLMSSPIIITSEFSIGSDPCEGGGEVGGRHLSIPEATPCSSSSQSCLSVPGMVGHGGGGGGGCSSNSETSRRSVSSTTSSIFDLSSESDRLYSAIRDNDAIALRKILSVHIGKFNLSPWFRSGPPGGPVTGRSAPGYWDNWSCDVDESGAAAGSNRSYRSHSYSTAGGSVGRQSVCSLFPPHDPTHTASAQRKFSHSQPLQSNPQPVSATSTTADHHPPSCSWDAGSVFLVPESRRESYCTDVGDVLPVPWIFKNALHVAIQYNSIDTLSILLRHGVDANRPGSTPLEHRGSVLSTTTAADPPPSSSTTSSASAAAAAPGRADRVKDVRFRLDGREVLASVRSQSPVVVVVGVNGATEDGECHDEVVGETSEIRVCTPRATLHAAGGGRHARRRPSEGSGCAGAAGGGTESGGGGTAVSSRSSSASAASGVSAAVASQRRIDLLSPPSDFSVILIPHRHLQEPHLQSQTQASTQAQALPQSPPQTQRQNSLISYKDEFSGDYLFCLPPLFFAAAQRNVSAVRLLLQHGALPRVTDTLHDCTPLHLSACAELRSVEASQALLEFGAEVGAVDAQGVRPDDLYPALGDIQQRIVRDCIEAVENFVVDEERYRSKLAAAAAAAAAADHKTSSSSGYYSRALGARLFGRSRHRDVIIGTTRGSRISSRSRASCGDQSTRSAVAGGERRESFDNEKDSLIDCRDRSESIGSARSHVSFGVRIMSTSSSPPRHSHPIRAGSTVTEMAVAAAGLGGTFAMELMNMRDPDHYRSPLSRVPSASAGSSANDKVLKERNNV